MTVFEQQLVDQIPALRQRARNLTQQAALADDLVQDTLTRALRKQDQFRAGTSLRNWLMTIMRNLWINGWRKSRRCPMASLESVADFLSTNEKPLPVDVDQLDDLQLESGAMATAIADLPDKFRFPLLLAVVVDWSYSDIARSMGVPMGTVMSRIHRAKRMVSRKMALSA